MSSSTAETFAFQAEINQLLSLIINAFYSNKDVFLRELISNASDALDKIRYQSLTDPSILGSCPDLDIKIIPCKEDSLLVIEDTGIGMSRDELIKNLGTIAHSGTRSFMEALQSGEQPDVSLIGQFGVGFYSAYLVADKVSVASRVVNGDTTWVWESSASGSFTIRPADADEFDDIKRGTRIILHLKEDQKSYLEENVIKTIIQKHNGYCSFPIMLQVTREVEEEVEEDASKDGAAQESVSETKDEEKDVEGVEEGLDEEDKVEETEETPNEQKKKKVIKKDFDKINKQPPIWLRKPEDVSNEEYCAFYKSMSGDWDQPLFYKHFSVDGNVQFKSLLYIPKRPPFDMFMSREEDKKRDNIKLYVKKVLIMDESNELLPEYLNFMKGVVDSDDLPLNVSREMLQQNSVMKVIKKAMVKRAVDMISELANATDDEGKKRWIEFYKEFNKSIKLGIHEDTKHRSKLIECLMFKTSKFCQEDDMSTFKQYVERMKPQQKNIYFVSGESLKAVKNSPFIKKLIKKGIEVLLLTDPIDEYMIQTIHEYDGKKLVCCSKEGLEIEPLDGDEEAAKKAKADFDALVEAWKPMCQKLKDMLESKAVDVRITENLDDDIPCVLVSDRYGWSANMERLMNAQALRNNSMMDMPKRRILEINPNHNINKELKKLCYEIEAGSDQDKTKRIKNVLDLMFDTVAIDSGFVIEEPSKYAQKVYRLISLGLSTEDEDDIDDEVAIESVATSPTESSAMEQLD